MKTVELVKRDGIISLGKNLDYVFSTLRNGRYEIQIRRLTEKRSVSQNDLLWLWLKCIEDETGTTKEDAYLFYCKKFLSKMVVVGNKLECVNDTSSRLNTKQMTQFLEKIRADAATELGITLPDPQDAFFETFFEEYK